MDSLFIFSIPLVIFLFIMSLHSFIVGWISLRKNKIVYFPQELLMLWIVRLFGIESKKPEYKSKISFNPLDWGPQQRGVIALFTGVSSILMALFLFIAFILPNI